MPDGSTRRSRFLARQKRFRYRMKRRRDSWPTVDNGPHSYPGRINHKYGPIVFHHHDVFQVSLWMYLKNPKNNQFEPPIYPYYVVSPASYGKPPHVTVNYLGPPPEHHHFEVPLVNYHNRPVSRVGHKIGRMNGYQRKCWFAVNWYLASRRIIGYAGYWPSWDPLGRTPVDDTPPWDV